MANENLASLEALLGNEKAKQESIENMTEYVDLDEIKFAKASIQAQQESIVSIFNSKPAYQVVCSQSGYMAKVSALVYKDIVAITNSNLSNLETKRETYRVLFSKITGYSAQKWRPTFEQWLEATSLGDVETLFYGLYCATFQDESTIRFDCPYDDCGETNIIKINNKQLIRVEDRAEMLELTNRISKEADTVEKIKEFSSVVKNKTNMKNLRLPESKIIFTIKLPSLAKVLDVLKTYSDAELATLSNDALNIILSTEAVAIPDSEGNYSYITDKKDYAGVIEMLSVSDISVLKNVVTKLFASKHITYCVEHQECTACKRKINKIPLDMEALLFFQISEKQLS